MDYIFDYYSDTGGRDNNEDSFCAFEKDGAYLFVVADGLGGHACGEVASGIAVEELRDRFFASPYGFMPEEAIYAANQRVMEKQKETGMRMKTTLTSVYICGDRTLVGNVGDSRTYLFAGGNIVFQSFDHSVSQMAVTVGEITPDQIRFHPDRNILTRALGSSEKLKADITEIPSSAYDKILLCSDGFWEYIVENEMIAMMPDRADPSLWLRRMKSICVPRFPRDNDNNTAVTVMRREGSI